MSLALEIRQVSNEVAADARRLDLANRLLHIASRVQRMELSLDEIVADAAQAERIAHLPPRPVFKLRLVP
jgi:hypothetical protein